MITEYKFFNAAGWRSVVYDIKKERHMVWLDVDKKIQNIENFAYLQRYLKSDLIILRTDNGYHVYSLRLISELDARRIYKKLLKDRYLDKNFLKIAYQRSYSVLRLSPFFSIATIITYPFSYRYSLTHAQMLNYLYNLDLSIFKNKLGKQGCLIFELYNSTKREHYKDMISLNNYEN